MPPIKHSLTEYITEQYTEHKQEKILFPGNENNQYDGSNILKDKTYNFIFWGPEFDSSSSICTNESSILSSSLSTLSVEKSGNKKRKISDYFAHSIPLSKQDKEHWEKLVLNSTIDNGLKLPSHKVLAGHILTSNSDKIRNSLIDIAKKDFFGVTIGFDGWKNIKKQEILELSLNFLDRLDELNIKYNAMITDSASQNQAASLVVSSEKAIQIISFLNRSVYFMEKLHDEQKFKYNKYFAVLLPCATCWNSHYHCYSSLLRTKFALKMLVSKYAPREFEADDNYTGNDENDREMPLGICRIIANEDWWKDIKKLEKLLLPFCGALNKLQTDNACLHDVLHCFAYFYKMWKEYPDQNLSARMITCLEKCWQIWEQPSLLLSFILHPEYHDKIFLQDNTSISIAKLSEWMIYYFCVWFKKVPDILLGELQNYHRQNFLFHNISLK
nr:2248_t:CDS:2 [Entrophospora candida]